MVQKASIEVLVLAAHAVELEGLPDALRTGGERIYGEDTRVRCASVGVGLTAAGAGTARALALHTPRAVVLAGSFGHYPSRAARTAHEAYVFDRVCLVDALVGQRKAAFPAPMPTEAVTDPALNALLEQAGARRLPRLGTTLAITTDDAAARALGEASGCEGENLEALAVLQACSDQRIPCAVVLACTNEVGARGREGWLANHSQASRTTAAVLEAFLHKLAC